MAPTRQAAAAALLLLPLLLATGTRGQQAGSRQRRVVQHIVLAPAMSGGSKLVELIANTSSHPRQQVRALPSSRRCARTRTVFSLSLKKSQICRPYVQLSLPGVPWTWCGTLTWRAARRHRP